jgi:two-component system nitrate/nitrite response regulator NarL
MGIAVLVAADVCFYREGLATCLAQHATIAIVGTATSRADIVGQITRCRPEVLLIDMAMAESLDTIRAVSALDAPPRVVALAVPETEHDVITCAEAGIAGYVSREGSLDDLVRTIESVARGELIVSPRMAATLMKRVATLASAGSRGVDRLAALTVREREIVRLIGDGLSNKQIAARLGIEIATAKNHVHNILDKLQVERRGQIGQQLRYAAPPAGLDPG